MRAYISGTGSYLPARVMTNAEVCQNAPVTEQWIVEKLGIETRHIAAPDEQTSDLAAKAAERAIERSGLDRGKIDGIILAMGTGDVLSPATAGYVQHKLGLDRRCFAFDMRAACAGAITGLLLARGLVESGAARNILLIGSHLISRTGLNWKDKYTAPLFGDGAGAAIVSRSPDPDRGIIASRVVTDGSLTEIVGQYAGGTRQPLTPELLEQGKQYLTMDGRAVWDVAVRVLPEVIGQVLDDAGLTAADVDFVVAHQANKRLLSRILELVGVPMKKTHTNIERYGNTVAASALIALDETVRGELVKPGDRVLMCAIGAGMSWGAHLFRW